MEENTFLSIVIPAFNEEENIFSTLVEISEYLSSKNFRYEIIIVDDGSRDRTVDEANKCAARFSDFRIIQSSPNMGKGYVLRKGMLKASGKYVMFMDADNSTSIKELDKFLPFFGEGFDIYIASRRIAGANVEVPFSRRFMGSVYIFFSRVILGVSVSDLNCGFKVFRASAAKEVFSKQIMNDWSFDSEIFFLAKKKDFRIKEIPVSWVHKATSKVKPLRDAVSSFVSLVKIRKNDRDGKYR